MHVKFMVSLRRACIRLCKDAVKFMVSLRRACIRLCKDAVKFMVSLRRACIRLCKDAVKFVYQMNMCESFYGSVVFTILGATNYVKNRKYLM